MNTFIGSKDFMTFCHNVFDRFPIPVDFLNSEGKIQYINKAFAGFLNLDEEMVVGKLVTDINPTSKFLDTLKNRKAEIAKKHKFDNGKEAIVHRIPIYDENSDLVGGFGMILFDDINKMKDVYETINKLDKELKIYKTEYARINSAKYNLNDIIGTSKAIESSKSKVKKIARVNSNVLIYGESGVGKELFAHSIHNESERKNQPFVSINCSAIPENLLESELFGYEEGSFTGAIKGGKIGKFELTNNGTIFLDEIGDMPVHMQAKLLRVLEEREIVRIGGKNSIPINVRVVCATHKNLSELVESGKFREDLYYRLNVLTLEVPPLRERKEDIHLLMNKFLDVFYKETGYYREIPESVEKLLLKHDWPGNIRELKNVVEKICVNAEDTKVGINDLPVYVLNKSLKHEYSKGTGLKEIMDNIEKEVISKTLKDCNNNKSEVAKKLNIPRATLYRKIEEYDL
jgi:transcriptional regulator with PAS, ATPase and Fis domain